MKFSFLWCFIFDHSAAEAEERIEGESESRELDLKFKFLGQQLTLLLVEYLQTTLLEN